jgi:archaeal type IV pilus assembly protein PilA
MNTRKGISPLIATLLLIAIAVAASVLTYSWVMSMVGSQSAQAQTQVRIDGVNWNTASVDVLLRNTGSVAATIESIAIRENKAGSTTFNPVIAGTNGLSIDTGATLVKNLTWAKGTATSGTTYNVGTSYVVRVTTTTGFYYESVVTSPSS